MRASFTALPVGQGDAFLVSSTAFSSLIDGGRSRTTLPTLLSKHRRGGVLNVVVCTHNDADHAEGLIGLFESRNIKIDQVWLPGQWTSRLSDLLAAPEAFMLEVFEQINALPDDLRRKSLNELVGSYGDVDMMGEESPPIVEVLDEAVEASARPVGRMRHLVGWWAMQFYPFRRMESRLLWEAIDAADRIRKLSYLAWLRAAAVRWFDVSSPPAMTTTMEPLSPVNAKEITRISPYKPGVLEYLALSVSNKKSLCFEFRPTSDELAVLLTADSDLNFVAPIRWSKGMIVTAPHHGSEANAHAYDRASQEFSSAHSIRWVRSDGRFRTRPGGTYLGRPIRYCTQCRPYNHREQTVRFIATTAGWITRATRCCRCM